MACRSERKGLLYVLVGPSGVGKNTLMKAALAHFPSLKQLPTATTRQQRAGEQEGREHFFVTRAQFDGLIEQGELLEWQVVHGELYGILRRAIEDGLNGPNDLIADIEVLGASILRREYPGNAVLIFVTPPDKPALEQRIRARGGADEAEIARRLQRADFEMLFAPQCDYLIINADVDQACRELLGIIYAEQSRHKLAHLTVSVLIYNTSGQVVVKDAADRKAPPALPKTLPLPDETLYQAALRLVDTVGVGRAAFCCRPNPAGEISPAHFHLDPLDGRNCLNLVFACQIDEPSPDAPRPGWRWEAVSNVPLAQSVWNSLLQAAPVE
jgi:guanylate kinase